VRRETISAYLRGAGVEIWPPGRWKREGKAKPAIQVITGSEAAKPAIPESGGHPNFNLHPNPENLSTKGKAKATSKPAIAVITDFGVGLSGKEPENSKVVGSVSTCEPYREIIELGLSRDRNAMAIWQDLVSDFGFRGGYQSVRRFAYKLRGAQVPPARALILSAPGEEGQVDYGSGPMVREAKNGKYRRTRLFVLTLGYSRKAVRLLVFRSSTRIWAELHEKAFRRLGGAPRILVLDNLREGVLVPEVYDATLNPLYRDVLAHYGAVALPCRIQDPDRKGKVERSVGHVKNTPLQGKHFESLEEGQAYLDRWETNWADTRIHGTTKRQVAAMFAEEKPTLLPLPVEPFRYYQYGEPVVHLDGCVEVEAAYYGLPPGWIGRGVKVQWDELYVRILDPKTGLLLREHIRQKRGWYAFSPRTTPSALPSVWCSCSAAPAEWAPMSVHFATLSIASKAKWACARILGVLALAKKYGTAAVDEACAAALEMGVQEYRFVRRFLERCPQAPLSLRQVDPLIRELVHYRDLIQIKTREQRE
jgi:transposase